MALVFLERVQDITFCKGMNSGVKRLLTVKGHIILEFAPLQNIVSLPLGTPAVSGTGNSIQNILNCMDFNEIYFQGNVLWIAIPTGLLASTCSNCSSYWWIKV